VRKTWYAGAIGIFLLGAAGAGQADVRPETGTAGPTADGPAVADPLRYNTIGGVLPSGLSPSLPPRPASRQTELFDGGLPLLGGLGGLPPSNTLPEVPGVPDLSGLPAGGMTIVPAVGEPATTATPSTEPRREFSPNGRPVAGIDQQYK
jgi:hypothetical protein